MIKKYLEDMIELRKKTGRHPSLKYSCEVFNKKKYGKRIVILCRDRKCIYNDYATDTCNIDNIVTIIKGKCVDRQKG